MRPKKDLESQSPEKIFEMKREIAERNQERLQKCIRMKSRRAQELQHICRDRLRKADLREINNGVTMVVYAYRTQKERDADITAALEVIFLLRHPGSGWYKAFVVASSKNKKTIVFHIPWGETRVTG